MGLKEMIADADYVLIGIGEEFNSIKELRKEALYEEGRTGLESEQLMHMLPLWNRCMLDRSENRARKALQKLSDCIKDKNYFIVSVCTNGIETEVGFDEKRLVSPCGGPLKVQCSKCCGEPVRDILEQEKVLLEDALLQKNVKDLSIGSCPGCGAPMVLNSVYTDSYDESGYLPMWEEYTKWLQRTLNRKLCVLELGVGLTYPSVIRWPFEKIGFFNQKASFVRVHETLYQLSEDLHGKGVSIAQNSIDWLLGEDL